MEKELGAPVDMEELKVNLRNELEKQFIVLSSEF